MTIGLIGKKCGMTRIFNEDGLSIPVSVVAIQPNKIVQVKTKDNDGYNAIQVTTGTCKASRISKPLTGHYAKANVAGGKGLWEFRLEDDIQTLKDVDLNVGSELTVSIFSDDQWVDVKGTSIGKGFAGVVKRHHFSMQRATHGNSLSHRAPGSIGQCQDPGRVFKGKKMAGHLGNKACTIQNQKIIKVDVERNLLLIKGGIPGAKSGYVMILPACKKQIATEK